MSSLDSKVVAITVASSGIGAATALELAARGPSVVLAPGAPAGSTRSRRGSGPRVAARRCWKSTSPDAPILSNRHHHPARQARLRRPEGPRAKGSAGNQGGVSPSYRNYCQPATGTASANCHLGTGTKVSGIYRTRTSIGRSRSAPDIGHRGEGVACQRDGFWREFCDRGHGGWWMTRLRRRSRLARPYICRLIALMRLTLSSVEPEL